MLSQLRKWHAPIVVYASGKDPYSILRWGEHFYSKKNENDTVPKEFTIYFPKTPVIIQQCKTMATNDVFPKDWSLLVSNDNQTWTTIIRNRTTCSFDNTYLVSGKNHYCKTYEVRLHDAEPVIEYSHFVKFEMQENTYYYSDGYKDLITMDGFELIGTYLCPNRICSKKYSRMPNKAVFFFIFMFIPIYGSIF